MYTIGFIDDDTSLVEDYKARLKRRDIELILAEGCTTKEDIVQWILKKHLKCVLVDYKLAQAYNFMGTDLVAYINSKLPDLPCIVLTSYCEDGIGDNLVVKNLFIDREVMDRSLGSTGFEDFISTIKQSVEVFDNRLRLHFDEYIRLKAKKESGEITAVEEEQFLNAYKLLRNYNEVDDIPTELLSSSANKKMDDILKALDTLIQKTE